MIGYQLIRSRRKTVSLQITLQGQVLVRCPLHMQKGQVDAFVQSKSLWIQKHLEKLQADPGAQLMEEEKARLHRQAKEVFWERVNYFAPIVGVTWEKITVRWQRTRWGSCSGKGNLNFNCLLLLAPPEVLDYVVVHELCHRKEMNHSKAFWELVAKVCPDYKAHRKWLKEYGAALLRKK